MAVRITSSQYPGQQCSVVLYSPTGNTIPYTNATSTNLGTKTLPFTYAGDDEYGVFEITINSNQAPCTGVAKTPPDGDGNTYKIIKIGDQIWMSENLKTRKTINGANLDNTSQVDPTTWSQSTEDGGKRYWADVSNNSANESTYGLIYNQYAVLGTGGQSLCPSGYHIPLESEYDTLLQSQGGIAAALLPLKSTTLWGSNGTNSSGFNGLPSGTRGSTGSYVFFGSLGTFWTGNSARQFRLRASEIDFLSSLPKSGCSVRCLKD